MHHAMCTLQTEVLSTGYEHISTAVPLFLHLRLALPINLTEFSRCGEELIDSSGDESPRV